MSGTPTRGMITFNPDVASAMDRCRMVTLISAVPEDPAHTGYDVFGVGMNAWGHFIHEVLALADGPLSVDEIARRARELAEAGGYSYRTNEKKAFDTTGQHLRQFMRNEKGYAEQLPDKRWRLTDAARQRLALFRSGTAGASVGAGTVLVSPPPEVRTVDSKSRLLLPKEFANATVTIERVGVGEIRIRKAVVIAQDELPLMEDHIKPLSDRDRDLFLGLLDDPPEPTPALRKAVSKHKNRHG